MEKEILLLLAEMIAAQKKELLKTAQRILPYITEDDILQPNDFPELELHPHFRYEEGVFHGLQMVEAALRSKLQESFTSQ